MKLTYAAARVNAGLSRPEAAKKLGISRQTLANWETYSSFPTILQVAAMAELYKVSIIDFIFYQPA